MPRHNFEDLTGQVFGRLTVIERADNDKGGTARWTCRCYCGEVIEVRGGNLRSGSTKSCKCFRRETSVKNGLAQKEHGHSPASKRSPTYNSWRSMIQRCTNPNHISYGNYGARGIGVHDPWRVFIVFLEYLETSGIGLRPEGKTIDRINNSLGYIPGNIQWSTRKEQIDNRRPASEWTKKPSGSVTLIEVAA